MKAPHIVLILLIAGFGAALVFYDVPVKIVDTPEKVTINYWEKWTGFESEAMRGTVDLFNSKKFKNAHGQVIFCNYLSVAQVDRKALLSISGGHPPDLCGFWSYNLAVFADMGALTPLDDFMKRDQAEMVERDRAYLKLKGGEALATPENLGFEKYIPVFLDTCKHRGKTWCLTTTPATTALHWNKDMFKAAGLDPERPPRTVKELDEFATKLTVVDETTGNIKQMGFLPTEPGWWNWGWGYLFGGKVNDGLEKLTPDDPANIAAFNWVTSYAEKYGREKTRSFQSGFGSFDSPQNAFVAGRVAMEMQGVWMANFIRFHNPNLNYGCAPFPSGYDDQGEPITFANTDVITIPTGSPHPEEAWAVIKFINTYEGMEYLCGGKENHGGQGKQTPFKVTTPGWVEQHPHRHLDVFIKLAKSKNATITPPIAVWDEYQTELTAAFDRMWLGEMTPEQALKSVRERMQAKLDRIIAVQKTRAETADGRK